MCNAFSEKWPQWCGLFEGNISSLHKIKLKNIIPLLLKTHFLPQKQSQKGSPSFLLFYKHISWCWVWARQLLAHSNKKKTTEVKFSFDMMWIFCLPPPNIWLLDVLTKSEWNKTWTQSSFCSVRLNKLDLTIAAERQVVILDSTAFYFCLSLPFAVRVLISSRRWVRQCFISISLLRLLPLKGKLFPLLLWMRFSSTHCPIISGWYSLGLTTKHDFVVQKKSNIASLCLQKVHSDKPLCFFHA